MSFLKFFLNRCMFLIQGLLLMGALSTANAGEHFEFKKEVTLTDNRSQHFAINSAIDGGYVLTGSIADTQAWAARLDGQGQELWSYLIPKDAHPENHNVSPSWHSSQFKSAVVLKNGNTLLCGQKEIGDVRGNVMGLITRVNIKGQFIDQRLLSPQGGKNFKINYIHQCAAWGEGYFVAGSATKFTPNTLGKSPPFVGETFFWLMALDEEGNVKWEKLISKGFSVALGRRLPWLIMANGDLVFSGFAPSIEVTNGLISVTGIIRIDKEGALKAQRNITGEMQLVRQPMPANAIRLVPLNLKESGMFLQTLNDDLTDASTVKSVTEKDEFVAMQAIEMSNHSIVLTGYRDFKVPFATIIIYSPDLHQTQDLVLKPKRQSHWIDDAILTSIPDEFAVIRSTYNSEDYKDRNIFSIIKVK